MEIKILLAYLPIIGIAIYLIRSLFFYFGSAIERANTKIMIENNNELPFVSILVPARNEQKNIKRCLDSLAESNYPKDKFEVFAINDRSSDKTSEIIQKLIQKYSFLKLINISEENRYQHIKGKAGALQKGIEEAKGEIVLMTDADCKVHPNWIRSIVSNYEADTSMIASFTLIKGKNIFTIFQGAEWVFLETMACGGIGLQQPLGCFGNNLSVRKSDFDEIGGYHKIKFSVTEDLALEQAMFRSNKKVKYICTPDATVKTLPIKTFYEYLRQRQRWVIGGQALGWRAAIFVGSSIAIWTAVLASLLVDSTSLLLLSILARIVGDTIVLFPTLNKLSERKLKVWVIPSILFFMIFELVVPFLALNKEVRWKGQVFR